MLTLGINKPVIYEQINDDDDEIMMTMW